MLRKCSSMMSGEPAPPTANPSSEVPKRGDHSYFRGLIDFSGSRKGLVSNSTVKPDWDKSLCLS